MVNIVKKSALDIPADAIINPANSFLNHGGGLARVIANGAVAFPPGLHAGEQEAQVQAWLAEQAEHPMIPTGSAGITSAGALRQFVSIIHAVGPIWPQDPSDPLIEAKISIASAELALAYESAFNVALDQGYTHVVAPAISAGIFGAPIESVAWAAKRAYNPALDVTFALMDDAHIAAFQAVFA